jgi:hypothetical protein
MKIVGVLAIVVVTIVILGWMYGPPPDPGGDAPTVD